MTPYKTLYGRRCRTPLCWYKNGNSLTLGPRIIQQANVKIKMIREKVKTLLDRKFIITNARNPFEFHEGDHVFLKVTPITRVGRTLKSRKLSPKFIGPYQILKRIDFVAYQITLPPNLSKLHNYFHVSQLRKYIHDPLHVIKTNIIQIQENFTYDVFPMRIEDRRIKQFRGKDIPLV